MVDNDYEAHTHGEHEDDPEAPQSMDSPPWNAQDFPHNLEHSRTQRNDEIFRDVQAIDNVLETDNDPRFWPDTQPTISPATSLVLGQLLSAEQLEQLRADVGDSYICLICTIEPPGALPIAKSKQVTKNSKEFWDTKPNLRQHINRVHLPCLTNTHYKVRHVCRRVFGVMADLTKHNKVCAKQCRTPDKPTIRALEKLRADVNGDGEMNAYALAQHQLPLLFFQVGGNVVKRYDAKDKTNNLNLPSPTVETNPCADEDKLQALREAMKAVKVDYMGTQHVNAIYSEVMGNDAASIPTAPSVQTQPLDTANQLSLAAKGNGVASSPQAESSDGVSFFDEQYSITDRAHEALTVDRSTFENQTMARLLQATLDKNASPTACN